MNAPDHAISFRPQNRPAPAALALVLLLALALAGCSTHSDPKNERLKDWLSTMDNGGKDMTFEQHAAMSRVSLDAGDAREALRQADKCLELKAGDAGALVLRAKALHRLDRQNEALDALAQALKNQPTNPTANLEAGRIYFASHLLSEAEQRFRAVLDSREAIAGGEAFQAHMLLGTLAEQRGDAESATRSYGKALELRPGNAEALNNLGVARMMLGEYAGAADTFSQAIRSGGAQERSCNNLGLALARQGRSDEALQAFKCAGSDAKAHNNLGYVLFVQGDYQGAVYHLERAVELSPVFYPQASENLKRARLAAGGVLNGASVPAVLPSASPVVVSPTPIRPASFPIPAQPGPAVQVHPEKARPAQRSSLPAERTISEEPEARLAPAPDAGVAELVSGGPAPSEVATQVGSAAGEMRMNVAAPAPQPAAQPAAPAAGSIRLAATEALPLETSVRREAAAPAQSSGASGWGLLISSWKEEGHAEAHVRKLAERGIEARIVQTDLGPKGVWNRVVWGSFASASQAIAARGEKPGGLDLSTSCPVRLAAPAAKVTPAVPDATPHRAAQVVAGAAI